jgi:hypothetical protein
MGKFIYRLDKKAMKLNYESIVLGNVNNNNHIILQKCILVPYRTEHVLQYHEWMCQIELLNATASEPLSLQEEYTMQQTSLSSSIPATVPITNPMFAYDATTSTLPHQQHPQQMYNSTISNSNHIDPFAPITMNNNNNLFGSIPQQCKIQASRTFQFMYLHIRFIEPGAPPYYCRIRNEKG